MNKLIAVVVIIMLNATINVQATLMKPALETRLMVNDFSMIDKTLFQSFGVYQVGNTMEDLMYHSSIPWSTVYWSYPVDVPFSFFVTDYSRKYYMTRDSNNFRCTFRNNYVKVYFTSDLGYTTTITVYNVKKAEAIKVDEPNTFVLILIAVISVLVLSSKQTKH